MVARMFDDFHHHRVHEGRLDVHEIVDFRLQVRFECQHEPSHVVVVGIGSEEETMHVQLVSVEDDTQMFFFLFAELFGDAHVVALGVLLTEVWVTESGKNEAREFVLFCGRLLLLLATLLEGVECVNENVVRIPILDGEGQFTC